MILLLSIIICSIIFSASCNSESEENQNAEDLKSRNSLIGEWKLLYAKIIFPDTTFVIDSSMYHSIYVVGDRYFNFFYSTPDKKLLTAAGMGTYLLEGSKYIENVQFHSTSYISGTSVIFDSKVEGDIWTHEGYLPVREEDEPFSLYAKGKPTFQLIEVRRRIKAPTF